MNIFKVCSLHLKFSVWIFVLEQISEGQRYDPRDIRRFNEIDEYTTMFIQHGQFSANFDEDRACRIFHAAMSWRKENKVYGNYFFFSIFYPLFVFGDISTNEFPANFFERNAIYFKNHDIYNNPLSMFRGRDYSLIEFDAFIY